MSALSGVSYIAFNGYAVNNIEDAVQTYIGKVKPDGTWLLQRYDSGTGAMDYANLSTNSSVASYASAWAARASLIYGGFETLIWV